MKGFLLALLIGLALGYAWGYKDADAGRPPVTTRTVDKFGVERVRSANVRREQAILSETP